MEKLAPILLGKDFAAPSIFEPDNLLREARRQRKLPDDKVPDICILDPDGDIVRALKARGPNAPVGEAMTTGIPTIGHRQTLDEAFRMLQETSAAAIGVVDAQGRLVGLVTSGTVGEMMMVRDALPGRAPYGPWSRPAGA